MALDGKPYMRPYSLVEEKVGSSHVSGPTRYYKQDWMLSFTYSWLSALIFEMCGVPGEDEREQNPMADATVYWFVDTAWRRRRLIYWRIFNNRYSLWYSLILGIKIDEKNVQTKKWKARDMLIQWIMPKIPHAMIYWKIFKRIYCKINKTTTDIQLVILIEIRNKNRLKKRYTLWNERLETC